jgi:nucleoside-diphosphate-sugar epimerase
MASWRYDRAAMKYFLTGSTGFIGGHVVRLLRQRGDQVVALVRDPGRARHLLDEGVEVVPGDVTQPETLTGPMRGVDGVFHIAGWYRIGGGDAERAWSVNVEGTRNVLRAMGEVGVPRGVYTSSLVVNSDTRGIEVDESYRFVGRHVSLYGATKAEAHRIALQQAAEGLPLVTVLPGVAYGPGDPSVVGVSLRQFLRGRLPLLASGAAYSWAHVEDVAQAHVLAMDRGRPGEQYIIAGPSHPLAEAMAMAAEVAGRTRPLVVPAAAVLAMVPLAGAVGRIVRLPDAYTPEGLRVASGPTYLGSHEKARRELGYAPRPLAAGWPQTVVHELATLG